MRTGEVPAVAVASSHLAKDVKLNAGGRSFEGHDAVLDRVTGQWPNTPVYVRGYWSEPRLEGDKVKVDATFPPMGAAPEAMHLTFSFNGDQQISEINQETVPQPRPEQTDTIPD